MPGHQVEHAEPDTDGALLEHAVTLGLVRAADVQNGSVALQPCSRSNVVHRLVLHGRPVAYAKQTGAAHRLDGVDAAARERAALRALRGLRCAPEALDGEPGLPVAPGVVWTAPVAGEQIGRHDLRRRPVAAVAVAWGAALAALHTATVTGFFTPPRAPRPWVLTPAELPAWARRRATEPLPGEVLAALRGEVALDRARLAVARWWPIGRDPLVRAWTHGDPSPSNVLIAPDGRVNFVDFEDAGLGDPSWDLARSLVTLRHLVTAAGLAPDEGRAELAASYSAHGGPGTATPEHLALATVLLAWQVALAPGSATHPHRATHVRGLLDVARDHAARRDSGRGRRTFTVEESAARAS